MNPICSAKLSYYSHVPTFRRPPCSSLPNPNPSSLSLTLSPPNPKPVSISLAAAADRRSVSPETAFQEEACAGDGLRVQVGSPGRLRVSSFPRLSLADRTFFLLAFVSCTTSVAFASFVAATVPALFAMGRAATSLSKLADTARKELPSTMAAIRLSGMEISDLTLELNDLSQEITDGVNKSAQIVRAAQAGIQQIGALAQEQTMSMIEERANLPEISLQELAVGVAKKTSKVVGRATKSLLNKISGGEPDYDDESESEYECLTEIEREEV